MTEGEVAQLTVLAREVGKMAVAVGKVEERIDTLFQLQKKDYEEELRYREQLRHDCETRHSAVTDEINDLKGGQSALLGFRNKWVGAGVLVGMAATTLGAVTSLVAIIGFVAGAWG